MDGDQIQPTVDKVKIAMPTIRGRRRPLSSLIGPTAICPRAMPAMEAVKVSWITDGVTPNAVIIDGRAGRYISVDNGAIAASIPNNTVMSKSQRLRLFCVIMIISFRQQLRYFIQAVTTFPGQGLYVFGNGN